MYIRCKRKKVTVFLQVEPTDTVLEVKAKLQALVDVEPAALQLVKDGAVLEDARRLSDLRVDNDDVVAMCYRREGALSCRRKRGKRGGGGGTRGTGRAGSGPQPPPPAPRLTGAPPSYPLPAPCVTASHTRRLHL